MDTKLNPQQVHDLKRIRHVVEETKAKEWLTDQAHSEDGSQHCFIGHMQKHGLYERWREIERQLPDCAILGGVENINDAEPGDDAFKKYPQKTPRARCLALLRKAFKFFGLKAR